MFEKHFNEAVEIVKKSEKYPGLEISFHLEVEGFYREERLSPMCSDPDNPAFNDMGEEEIFEIHRVTVLNTEIWSYPEEESREIDNIIEDIEIELDNERRQGLIEKLSILCGIGSWNELSLTEKEEDDIRSQVVNNIFSI